MTDSTNRPEKLTWEMGYELVKQYVNYNWSKFTVLHSRMDKEDAVQNCMLKFWEKKYFDQYDPAGTSPKWFIAKAVSRWFIDETRKIRMKLVSTEEEIGDGITVGDTLASNQYLEEEVFGEHIRDYILGELPMETESTILLMAPGKEDHRFSLRNLAELLEEGYTIKDITAMTLNPANGKPCTSSRVSAEVKKLRELVSVLR